MISIVKTRSNILAQHTLLSLLLIKGSESRDQTGLLGHENGGDADNGLYIK